MLFVNFRELNAIFEAIFLRELNEYPYWGSQKGFVIEKHVFVIELSDTVGWYAALPRLLRFVNEFVTLWESCVKVITVFPEHDGQCRVVFRMY